jgi:hypothetical protein
MSTSYAIHLLQDILFTSEKIYSVLAVVLLLFASVLVLLFRQERKISSLEKEMDKREV